MTELLTAAQMRAIEAAAIASGEVTGLELMERAGRGVVEAVLEEWPEMALTSQRAVVLCGPGNNGGDGFVVARLLKERGWEVGVFLYGDAGKLPPDARVNYERWGEMGEVRDLQSQLHNLRIDKTSLSIDSVFGTGITRELNPDIANFFARELTGDQGRERRVAIDSPSGICLDSGSDLGAHEVPEVALTVTFHRMKLGHFLGKGVWKRGSIRLVDIGLDRIYAAARKNPSNHNKPLRTAYNANKQQLVRIAEVTDKKLLGRKYGFHKYHHGHAVMVSGPRNQTGAVRLAARGAIRIGAGLVTIAAPSSACPEHAAHLNAIMLREVDKANTLQVLLEDTRINALCIGPALGLDDRAAELVAASLEVGRSTVLDADALTLLARNRDLFGKLHANCVLTPHAGEFARLFPDLAEKLAAPATTGPAYSKVDATREAAARAGCVVLYKGADTVIAGPDGRCSINSAHYERAAPWLATAGSGDVLAGFITGLLARGFAPMAAAEAGAWLHVECARKFGPGLIAEDLPEMLPGVFRDLGL